MRANPSLAVGRAARDKASTRTPVQFYLDVPTYVYDLSCKDLETGESHLFRSRTPATPMGGMYHFWCERCREYQSVRAISHQPINRPHSTDELVALEQDQAILRERIAREILARGFLETEEGLAEVADEFGVPVREVRIVSASLAAPDLPTVCRAGLHELGPGNLEFESNGRRTCRACRLETTRERVARYRERKRARQAHYPEKLAA